jgi:hypothetical protein
MTYTDSEIAKLLSPSDAAAYLSTNYGAISARHLVRLAEERKVFSVETRLGKLFDREELDRFGTRRIGADRSLALIH